MNVFIVKLGSHVRLTTALQRNPICWANFFKITKQVCDSRHLCDRSTELATFRFQCRTCSSSAPNRTIRSSRNSGDLMRLLRQAKPERSRLAVAVTLLFVSSSVLIAFPFCIGKVIDVMYTSTSEAHLRDNLNRICKILTVVVVIGGLANFGRVYLMNSSAQRIIHSLRKQAHASIIRQEIAFFDRTRTGDLVTRLSNDTTLIGMSLTQNISDGLRSSIAVLGGVGMMFYTSPQLCLVGLGVVPPVAVVSFFFARKLKIVAADVQTRLAHTSAIAEEQFSNMRTVRAFGKEDYEKSRYMEGLSALLERINSETKLKALFFGCSGASGNVIVLSVLYYGGVLMSQGQLTVGSLSSFLLYAAYVGISIGGLGSFFTEAAKAVGASKKVWEIIDRTPALPVSGGMTLPELKGDVAFHNITFSYPTRPEMVILNNLSLVVPAGSILAVVGPSGQGKSTLAALLLRLYEPSSGLITLDGTNVQNLDPQFLRINIGIVSQEPTLFAASIFENILYGAKCPEKTTHDEVVRAAQQANALDFIESLPDGFHTLVGERGVLLSGGQKQRIAIARAILRDPKILVLDEATSSLDALSERAVQEALKKLMRGRTVLTIAHRLSTVRRADTIVVLKGGSIVESGTYGELLEVPGGLFRSLVQNQIQDEVMDKQNVQTSSTDSGQGK